MSRRFLASLCAAAVIMIYAAAVPAGAAGEQELFRFPFQDPSAQGSYFTCGDSASIEWVNEAGVGHGDDTALRVVHTPETPYTSSSNAVVLTLPEELPAGGTYRIRAWIYAPSAENSNKSTLTGPGFVINDSYPGEQGVVKFPADFGTLPLDEWMAIDVTLPMQELPISRLDFRIVINDEPNHPDVWYWDDIEIYQVGDLQAVASPTPEPLSEDGFKLLTRNTVGTHEGVDYELWSQNSTDDVSMVLTGGATFRCDWTAQNVLFRMGKRLGSTQTYKEYGDITLQYAADYEFTRGDVNYLCVYGWTIDPLMEYYILEDYGNYKPGTDLVGTYEADGSTYELYTTTRVQQPSIFGTQTFPQYFGIRVDKRTEGTISISEHFKAWEDLGLDMSGLMYEVSLCVEGYSSAGHANVYEHVLTVGDTTYGFLTEEAPKPSAEPSESVPAPIETEAPATEAPSPTPDAGASDEPDSGTGGLNPAVIIGLVIAAVLAVAAVIAVIVKKRGSSGN